MIPKHDFRWLEHECSLVVQERCAAYVAHAENESLSWKLLLFHHDQLVPWELRRTRISSSMASVLLPALLTRFD